MIEIITTIWRQIFQQSSEKTLTRSLWKGLFWILLGVGMPLNAVIDVGYRQDETGEVRLIDSGGSETEVVASGGSFIVDSNYALIVNPNDIEGYPYITYSNTKAYRIMTYLFGTMD